MFCPYLNFIQESGGWNNYEETIPRAEQASRFKEPHPPVVSGTDVGPPLGLAGQGLVPLEVGHLPGLGEALDGALPDLGAVEVVFHEDHLLVALLEAGLRGRRVAGWDSVFGRGGDRSEIREDETEASRVEHGLLHRL